MTGGSVYLGGGDGPTISPTGGSTALLDDATTDRALSALRRNECCPLGDELKLLRRSRDCTGDTICVCDIGICGKLWLCVCEYDTPAAVGGETLATRSGTLADAPC